MHGTVFYRQLASRPPFTRLHPRVAAFFHDYLEHEKAVPFAGRHVINTHFPPYPSPAFDQLAAHFTQLGDAANRSLYSVTLALTNRCSFQCWHCYNAGRSQHDIPLSVLARVAKELQELGAAVITLTGGEPLLRHDLDQIVQLFDDRSCLVLGTTGDGLTPARARELKTHGLFAVGISLDSDQEPEHDRLRGRPGAFQIALQALRTAADAGLYPYVVSVATREFLQRDRFFRFLRFAAQAGALEVHLLEPSATGKLAGRRDVVLTPAERQSILNYQREVARDELLPILSSFTYLESPQAFGCGAGLTHLYIDGSGEVCPCNLVPMSFGNVADHSLTTILERMGHCFRQPRTGCVGRILAPRIPVGPCPTPPDLSAELCQRHLPREHPLPRFFEVQREARESVGAPELQSAYNQIHGSYDDYWVTEAAKPIDRLIPSLKWTGHERVFEAGCGTGYASALLASRAAELVAVDLSEGMLQHARQRLAGQHRTNVRFLAGDALEELHKHGQFDLVFTSWVLGYIALQPFFAAAFHALRPGGQLAFIVHRENSPARPLEIFAELVAEDPSVLQKQVAFDFPRDARHASNLVEAAGFHVQRCFEDHVVFPCASAQMVLDHLLKSGAGTAFYDAIDPLRREALTCRFLDQLDRDQPPGSVHEVAHEYVACVAVRP